MSAIALAKGNAVQNGVALGARVNVYAGDFDGQPATGGHLAVVFRPPHTYVFVGASGHLHAADGARGKLLHVFKAVVIVVDLVQTAFQLKGYARVAGEDMAGVIGREQLEIPEAGRGGLVPALIGQVTLSTSV